MSKVFEEGIHIFKSGEYTDQFRAQWVSLFQRCFGGTEEYASRVFQKYSLNDSRICIYINDGTMVAAYCGLRFSLEDGTVFLSTDTMSDGTKKGSSVLLGKRLYGSLVLEDVYVVCGYPNENIRKIRERGLGWTLKGNLYLYVGIPFLWRFLRKKAEGIPLWKVQRPDGGWFTKAKSFNFQLLGREGLYSSQPGLVITLSAYRPGLFFIRVPKFLFDERTFGYKFLTENEENKNNFLKKINYIDIDTIDLP